MYNCIIILVENVYTCHLNLIKMNDYVNRPAFGKSFMQDNDSTCVYVTAICKNVQMYICTYKGTLQCM